MMISKSIRLTLIALTTSVFLLASGCGGGGGGGGGDDAGDDFPTPRLPADAVELDATNANSIANVAVSFTDTLGTVAELKAESSPSIPQVARMVTDQVMRRTRHSASIAARTEDISEGLCVTGTAIADFDESGDNESGSVTFSDCSIDGAGEIVINGRFTYDASMNDTTLNYSFHLGGSLTMAISSESITIVMNMLETGNDGTGAFSSNISYSLSGIPDSGFLVTTAQPLVGTVFTGVTAGQLIVHGSVDTRLRITVTSIDEADVDLDNGDGNFVFDSTISI